MQSRYQRVRSTAGAVVLLVCVSVVVGRVARATPPPAKRSATPAERELIALELISPERRWRAASKRRFAGDHWSQDDDFHRAEQYRARGSSDRLNVSLTDVLRAIDEGLRAHPAGRRVTASPCKPRPFYD